MRMLYEWQGHRPKVGAGVYLAPGARVIGRVTLEAESSVWFNAVLRGDVDEIVIGSGSNVQDGTVIHCDNGFPVTVGRNVTIGHSCIIHGCTIGDNVLVGMGTTILNGAKIGENCLIGAGSLITEGKEFPPGSVIMGRPAKVVRQVGERELEMIRRGAEAYRQNARLYAQDCHSVS
jgi:carbonic anhydrase/acetyltransferase-like protein (isoleucine patch superfamily)